VLFYLFYGVASCLRGPFPIVGEITVAMLLFSHRQFLLSRNVAG
jgi:hypothetical protein